jgi:hypothetical protein
LLELFGALLLLPGEPAWSTTATFAADGVAPDSCMQMLQTKNMHITEETRSMM